MKISQGPMNELRPPCVCIDNLCAILDRFHGSGLLVAVMHFRKEDCYLSVNQISSWSLLCFPPNSVRNSINLLLFGRCGHNFKCVGSDILNITWKIFLMWMLWDPFYDKLTEASSQYLTNVDPIPWHLMSYPGVNGLSSKLKMKVFCFLIIFTVMCSFVIIEKTRVNTWSRRWTMNGKQAVQIISSENSLNSTWWTLVKTCVKLKVEFKELLLLGISEPPRPLALLWPAGSWANQ